MRQVSRQKITMMALMTHTKLGIVLAAYSFYPPKRDANLMSTQNHQSMCVALGHKITQPSMQALNQQWQLQFPEFDHSEPHAFGIISPIPQSFCCDVIELIYPKYITGLNEHVENRNGYLQRIGYSKVKRTASCLSTIRILSYNNGNRNRQQ